MKSHIREYVIMKLSYDSRVSCKHHISWPESSEKNKKDNKEKKTLIYEQTKRIRERIENREYRIYFYSY